MGTCVCYVLCDSNFVVLWSHGREAPVCHLFAVVDMIQERNALMEHVYPKLKKICREKFQLEFQVSILILMIMVLN